MRKLLSAAALATAVLASVGATRAGVITFDLAYSGAPFGNSATATGSISFDDSVLPPGPVDLGNVSAATLGVVSWSLTVSDAIIGNGGFTLADLQAVPALADGWVWQLSRPLDLSSELVGQVGFDDFNWCAASFSCGNPLAPGGFSVFQISTAGELGDLLQLTSMARMSAVPEPATLALVVAGGLLARVCARRSTEAALR